MIPDRVPVFEYIRKTYGDRMNILFIMNFAPHEVVRDPYEGPELSLFARWTEKQWVAQRAANYENMMRSGAMKPEDWLVCSDDMPQSVQTIVGASWTLTYYILDEEMRIICSDGRFEGEEDLSKEEREERAKRAPADRIVSADLARYLKEEFEHWHIVRGGTSHPRDIVKFNSMDYAIRRALGLPPAEPAGHVNVNAAAEAAP